MIDLNKLKPTNALSISLVSICSTVPGLLNMYIFRYSDFIALDTIKLIMLAISLSVPFFAISLFCILFSDIIDGSYTNDKRTSDIRILSLVSLTSVANIAGWIFTCAFTVITELTVDFIKPESLMYLVIGYFLLSHIVLLYFIIKDNASKQETPATN